MAKLQTYELKKLGQQLVDFNEDITDIINLGKVAHVIVSAVPSWAADNGEMAFYDGSSSATLSGKRIYVRLASSWEVFATAPFVGFPGGTEGSLQYNSSNAFGGDEYLKWSRSGFVVNMTGGIVLTGSTQGIRQLLIRASSTATLTAQTVPIVEVTDGRPPNSGNNGFPAERLFAIDSNGNVILGATSGGKGLTKALVFSGDGTFPTSGHGDAVMFGDDGDSSGAQGVRFVSQNNTDHGVFIGRTVVLYDQNANRTEALVIMGGPAEILLTDGNPGSDPGPKIYFSTSYGHTITLGMVHPGLGGLFVPSSNYLSLTRADAWLASRESPLFVIQDLQWQLRNPAVSFENQRFVMMSAPSISSSSAGVVHHVSTVATCYIDAPVITNTNATVTNLLALWLNGNMRIDGTITAGASPTATKTVALLFTTTAIGVASNNASELTLIRGIIGTTSLVANTLSEGRTIRLQAAGYYSTPAIPDSLTMRVKLGGTTILSTGAQTPTASASTLGWSLDAQIACWTTGGAGTVMGQGLFEAGSTIAGTISDWRMVNSSTTVINTTGANVVEISAQWGGAQATEQLFMTNCIGELLN